MDTKFVAKDMKKDLDVYVVFHDPNPITSNAILVSIADREYEMNLWDVIRIAQSLAIARGLRPIVTCLLSEQ